MKRCQALDYTLPPIFLKEIINKSNEPSQNEKDQQFYEENISDIIGYYDISPLILRNNGFTDEIISKFRKALIQYDEEEYVIFK